MNGVALGWLARRTRVNKLRGREVFAVAIVATIVRTFMGAFTGATELGSTTATGEQLGRALRYLVSLSAFSSTVARAFGYWLAILSRGRWFSGLAVAGPNAFAYWAISVLSMSALAGSDHARRFALHQLVWFVLVALLFPLVERLVPRAFTALGVSPPDEEALA